MRLLLTGFEPFGGETVNPSAEIVRAFQSDPPPGVQVTALILPVRGRISFDRLIPAFAAGTAEGPFDAWLGLGQAGGRAHLSVERVGINLLMDRPSTQGVAGEVAALVEQPLVEGGPAAYFSRLPVVDLARHISETGVPAAVSNTAGAYICNEVTYAMQHHMATAGLDVPSGLIHLPYLPEQIAGKPGVPSMALETQIRGVRAAVEFVAAAVRDR